MVNALNEAIVENTHSNSFCSLQYLLLDSFVEK